MRYKQIQIGIYAEESKMTKPEFNLSLDSLRQAYTTGTIAPRQVVRSLRHRCDSYLDQAIWTHRLTEEELEPYLRRLETLSPARLPLFGIPFAIKDNIDLAGIPTTAACPAFTYTPKKSAFVVEQLIAAGAIPLGKTNLDQFATGLVGVRSPAPWGACRNSVNPDYISGGSSSGSAVAVALGLVSFSLGTDTAGSGRVPASFNNLIGLKPTLGRLSVRGVVPACKTLDCISIFARSSAEAKTLLELSSVEDKADPWQRVPPAGRIPFKTNPRIGVPAPEQLDFDGDKEAAQLFKRSLTAARSLGAEIVEIDLAPFTEAARLLYEGPWVTERYLATQPLIDDKPESLLAVTREIIGKGRNTTGADAFQAQYRLRELKQAADRVLAEVDLILTPTAPRIYTLSEIAAEPIERNNRLGTYTNFMNLLDYSAVAVPAGHRSDGLPWGVTIFSRAWSDEALLGLAGKLHAEATDRVGALSDPVPSPNLPEEPGTIDVVVCGAHLSGLPLNHQLIDRNARLMEATHTAARYRFYALAGEPPFRPGLVRDIREGQGATIAVEIWRVPADHFGSFVAGIPAPLGIGKVELADGRWVCGFICEPWGIVGAKDITDVGSWRNYIEAVG